MALRSWNRNCAPLRPKAEIEIAAPLGLTAFTFATDASARGVLDDSDLGPALIVGGWALEQLWMFWVAPIIGGAVGALVYGLVAAPKAAPRAAVASR